MEFINENLRSVENEIQKAVHISNRKREDVLLLAVTKTQCVEDMQKVYTNNIICFAENKVQELTEKYEHFNDNIKWHFIGHLQRNKVKQVVGKVELIHSVDSIRLAVEIDKYSQLKNCVTNILVEVNVAMEESKHGIYAKDLEGFILELSKLENIKVKGLMTVAPFVENPEDNREIFKKLNQLLVDINGKNIHNIDMTELSMGMTNDYSIAIQEGATMVRVGTAIFGKRNYVNIN